MKLTSRAALVLLCLTWTGCLIDDSPPGVPSGTCNANGQCDQDEDCQSCPADCACCNAILAHSPTIAPTDDALGSPDGTVVQIGELEVIELTFGLEAADNELAPIGDPDISISGTITSASSAASKDCPESTTGIGAFEVFASADGKDFRLLGLWTQQKNTFDLGCAGLRKARVVRIQAQPSAEGGIDAITAINCGDQ